MITPRNYSYCNFHSQTHSFVSARLSYLWNTLGCTDFSRFSLTTLFGTLCPLVNKFDILSLESLCHVDDTNTSFTLVHAGLMIFMQTACVQPVLAHLWLDVLIVGEVPRKGSGSVTVSLWF